MKRVILLAAIASCIIFSYFYIVKNSVDVLPGPFENNPNYNGGVIT